MSGFSGCDLSPCVPALEKATSDWAPTRCRAATSA